MFLYPEHEGSRFLQNVGSCLLNCMASCAVRLQQSLASHNYSLLWQLRMSVTSDCRKGIQLAHVGNCTALEETDFCPNSCPEDEDAPVCGSDGNVYR